MPLLLIIAALLLFFTENLFHYPIAIMSLLGGYEFARHRIGGAGVKYLCCLFFAIWLPMVFSSFFSSNPSHSWKTTLAYLHFLPATYYVVLACSKQRVGEAVKWAVVFFCAFLVMDGVIQFTLGQNVLGYPLQGNSVTGIFHPKQRLALYLAVFAPICVDFVATRKYSVVLILLFCIPYLFVVFVSLKRSSWLMLMVGLLLYGLFRYRASLKFFLGMVVSLFLVFVVASTIYVSSESFSKQVNHSIGLVSGDIEAVDHASNRRLTLWAVGLEIFTDNPVFGVGPRGYRYNYEKYAGTENFWIKNFNSGQTHPHLMLLEILVETGLVGLLLYLLVLILIIKAGISSIQGPRVNCWLLGAIVAWLPFNTHLAFYGSYWASLVWLLLAIGLASLQNPLKESKCS